MMGQKSRSTTVPAGDCGEAVSVTEVSQVPPVRSDPLGVRVAAERVPLEHLGIHINRDFAG